MAENKDEAVKSTHSDSATMGAITPLGGNDKKRPADKKGVGDKNADTSAAEKVTVAPEGAVRKEDLDILFKGSDLSEEFQDKAFTLFEGAVSAKVSEVTANLREELEAEFNQSLTEAKEELEEKLSDYLELCVDNYMKENEIAIENGIKAEIAESLLSTLRDTFLEHNIDIPEEKVNIVESLTERVSELETELNEALTESVANKKIVESFEKTKVLAELSEGMDTVSREKFVKLTEHLSFGDAEAFTKAATVLKESISPDVAPKNTQLNEAVDIEDKKPTNSRMAAYLETARAISKI